MACDIELPASTSVLPTDTSMDVIGKFKLLSEAALATDSIYMRAKDTFKELFDDTKMTNSEYAQAASTFISQLAVSTTNQAMDAAIKWADQEKKYIYEVEAIKANAELVMAQREKMKYDICLAQEETKLKQAQVKAAMSASIRDNGRILTYENDGYTPASLRDEGTKFLSQMLQSSQTYATLADAYRKSGVVEIAPIEAGSLVWRGISGDQQGYTLAQEKFAKRQILSFEDSKRSHAANAVSQMISQLLAQEVVPDAQFIEQWNRAISYLTLNSLDANYDGIPDGVTDADRDGVPAEYDLDDNNPAVQ